MKEQGLRTVGQGSVIPPEYNFNKVDLGEAELKVRITNVSFRDMDDCIFIQCEYPKGQKKTHQLFKPVNMMTLQHKMLTVFNSVYGKTVAPTNTFPQGDPTGFIATFKEI